MYDYSSYLGGSRDNTLSVPQAVVLYPNRSEPPSEHETATLRELAKKLAAVKGSVFRGDYHSNANVPAKLYFIPTTTIGDRDTALRLGIAGEDDLFGGVVAHPCVATKAITHPLVDAHAFAPAGWSTGFSERVKDVTIAGFSAFALSDAIQAGQRVLERGPARVKPANASGGRGQTVVRDMEELDRALGTLDEAAVARHGVVIEQNLDRVSTLSVGQVRVANCLTTYYGKQRQTRDNRGEHVYGGSDLFIVRGDYERLLALALPPEISRAIAQARIYDRAAEEFYGLLASRRNYDVAQGIDPQGERRSGVLEQSWRVGGASAAEIAALEAFWTDENLQAVRASCFEAYGEHEAPSHAAVHFRGIDDRVGAITKYTVIDKNADRV